VANAPPQPRVAGGDGAAGVERRRLRSDDVVADRTGHALDATCQAL
jgi:hypothetical protein